MTNVLDQSIPYFRHFEEMTRIPHGSFHEKPYSDYLVRWAKEHGLRSLQDEMGNVIIYKPASPGREDRPALIMQAHMDMVCVKTPESDHDFLKDPLDIYVDGDWLKARDTTLGADDGIGCAYMLAILEDDSLVHPPLECVFTVQEEVGCKGAANLKAEYFKASRMIGLDQDGGGATYVTTAGSHISQFHRKVTWEKPTANAYCLTLSGLLGGHSGVDIDKEHGSAVKIAAITLFNLMKKSDIRLAGMNLGSVSNAIPDHGEITFTCDLSRDEVYAEIDNAFHITQNQLRWSDPDLVMTLKDCTAERVMSAADTADIVRFARFLPDGFFHRSMHFKDLTTVSSNLGVWRLEGDTVMMECNARSSMESYLELMDDDQEMLSKLYNMERIVLAKVPSYDYIENSKVRAVIDQNLFKLTGRHITELYVHGGIEAAFLVHLVPNLDVATIGPIMAEYHTPSERLSLSSYQEIWQVLINSLADL